MLSQAQLFFFAAVLLLGYASAFHGMAVPPTRHSYTTTTCLKAESQSESEQLPPLDPGWIKAALQPFSWDDDAVVPNDDDDTWQNGQRWFVTREALMDLWVLPRDMSKGSWDNYADAAIKKEEKVLNAAPQLLRLETALVLESAQTVLNDLKLPPALLRREPILLTMDPDRLRGGFARIVAEKSSDESTPAEACRDTHGLLVEAATKWIRDENNDADISQDGSQQDAMKTTDGIQLLQKSFDNEVSADDVHMKSFLGE